MVTNANTSSHIKFWFPKVCLKRVFSPNVRESKTILDSGFQILDSRSQALNFGNFVSGTGIPDFNRWWDSQAKLSRTLESRFPFTKEEVCMKAMTEDFFMPTYLAACWTVVCCLHQEQFRPPHLLHHLNLQVPLQRWVLGHGLQLACFLELLLTPTRYQQQK